MIDMLFQDVILLYECVIIMLLFQLTVYDLELVRFHYSDNTLSWMQIYFVILRIQYTM